MIIINVAIPINCVLYVLKSERFAFKYLLFSIRVQKEIC